MLESVLLVDDDDDLRAAMQEALHEFGVRHMVEAGCLREVEEHRDDALACQLALVDINLGYGEPTGVDVFEWFKRQGYAGRVVFLTGHGSQDPRVQRAASVAGAKIVSKPLSMTKLRDVIS